jgi:hypothetical protein
MQENPGDQPAKFFYKKATYYNLNKVPENWTGIEKMEMK